MQNINTLEEQINYYKKEIQNLKEHYGEFELETNQEIKKLQERIDKALYWLSENTHYTSLKVDKLIQDDNTNFLELLEILKGEKEND